eukprot:gene14255-15742_t
MNEIEENREAEVLKSFLRWCKDSGIKFSNKIQITCNSTSHRYGVVALQDVKCNETLVDIPRVITFSPSQSSIAKQIEEFEDENKENFESQNLDLYKHMVGFMMSYSFTDTVDGTALMVPVADIFNHHSNNNTALSFENQATLRMISTKSIKKGEEVFNTFGKLGNSQLLHMYGFVEQSLNAYDIVEIPLASIVDMLEAADANRLVILQAMLAYMRKMGIADEKEPLVFCPAGLRSGPNLYAVLRILHMELKEFTGLLKDHIKWYQDSFFSCLLQHITEAAIDDKKDSKEADKVVEIIDDSDDDVVIVKEVNVNKEASAKAYATNEPKQYYAKQEGENHKFDQASSIGSEIIAPLVTIKAQDNAPSVRGVGEPTVVVNETPERQVERFPDNDHGNGDVCKAEEIKKDSPSSDGQKKHRSRKRRFVQQAFLCNDSDEEMEMQQSIGAMSHSQAKLHRKQEDPSHNSTRQGFSSNAVRKEEVEEKVYLSSSKHGDDEDGYSEDPEDGTDEEDSETYLQLTYDQISSVLPPSWKATMQSVVASVLASMKADDPKEDESKMTQRRLMARTIRSGQRSILKLLEKSLAS